MRDRERFSEAQADVLEEEVWETWRGHVKTDTLLHFERRHGWRMMWPTIVSQSAKSQFPGRQRNFRAVRRLEIFLLQQLNSSVSTDQGERFDELNERHLGPGTVASQPA